MMLRTAIYLAKCPVNKSSLFSRSKLNKLELFFTRSKSSRSPGSPSSPGTQSNFSRILKLALPEKYRLTAAVGLLLVSSGITMSVPFAIGKIIDLIYNLDQLKESEQDLQRRNIQSRLRNVCLGLSGIFVIGGLCNFGRVYLMRISGQNITAALRTKLFSSILKQETAFFDKNKTGELINRLSADTQLVSLTLTQQVSDGLRSSMMSLAGVGMMFYMSPQLAMVGLAIVPPVSMFAILMGRNVRRISREVQDSLAASTDLAEEKLSNIRTVRAFAMEETEIRGYGRQMDQVLEKTYREALINAKFYGMTGVSGNMIVLTVLYYGGNLVTTEVLSVGNLTSFVLYSAYVGIGLSGVSTFYAEMMKGLGASSRIWDLMDRNPAIPVQGGIVPSAPPKGEVTFQDVTFAYPNRPDINIMRGLTLNIPPNTVVIMSLKKYIFFK